jgi:hypothetical protein
MFLRSKQLFGYLNNSPHFIELGASLQFSQIHILSEISPHHQGEWCKLASFRCILSSIPKSLKWALYITFSDENFVSIFLGSRACYMAVPSHNLWLRQPNRGKIGKDCKSWSSSLSYFFPASSSSLLGSKFYSSPYSGISFVCVLPVKRERIFRDRFINKFASVLELE